MKIALRPSGGRGEYELAGAQGGLRASELIDRDILYEITPDLTVPSGTRILHLDGKTRVRTFGAGVHAYRAMRALLLLPRPIREIRKTSPGTVSLTSGGYSILSIDVDVARVDRKEVVLRPTMLTAGNFSGNTRNMNFVDRLDRIERIWEASKAGEDALSRLLRDHHAAVTSSSGDFGLAERVVRSIADELRTEEDPLGILEDRLLGTAGETPETEALATPEDDPSTPLEVKRRLIAQWRIQASRGPKSREFSDRVRRAYDYRCMFSGDRLPTTRLLKPSGVVAAHILPWRHYDLDVVSNGLCLNPLCHWGFDVGLLRLNYDRSSNVYTLDIPANMAVHAGAERVDIGYFRSLVGVVPDERLPSMKGDRPSPQYLRAFNQAFSE
jgi:hypothetical protein